MGVDYGVIVRRNTWLYALDPRVKLAFVLVGSLLTFLWPNLGVAVGVALVSLVLLSLAQVPPVQIARFVRGLLPLLLMVIVLTALFGGNPGPLLFSAGPLSVTAGDVYQGFLLAARLLAISLVFYFWLSTTDQAAMVRGFVALRMPYEWGLALALALRYLPILGGLIEQVREAQQARGLDLSQHGFLARLQAYRPILVAVVIGALRHGERLGWALEARALAAPGVTRTTYRPLHLGRIDVLALLVLAAIAAGAILLRLF
jgi:energy-coupling factor transport system permease protein